MIGYAASDDDELIGPHGSGDHGEAHGHNDDAHAVEPLGPIDVVAWTYAALGVVLGLVVAAALAVGSGALG